MRTHRLFPALQPWSRRSELLRDLVSADNLAALRLEPASRQREPIVLADLHFRSGDAAVTIPLVYVDLAQLDVREADPLIFPHGLLGVVSDAQASAIVERVFPDLERRALLGGFWNEEVLRYGDAGIFDAARERGFFGAAALSISLPRIAAAVYAQRIAVGRNVVAYGSDGPALAAVLSSVAASCAVVGDDAAAFAWYGHFAAPAAGVSADLAIGEGPPPVPAGCTVRTDVGESNDLQLAVAAPRPADVLISFDPADGSAAGGFSVHGAPEPFVRPIRDIETNLVAGGSTGRIALVVRPDAEDVPDSDTAEAVALAGALHREGFAVDIVSGIDALEAFDPELVHLFGVRPGSYARRVAEWASNRRRPLVVHAFYESPAAGSYWGAMATPYCFGYSGDDRSVSTYLDLLATRAVEVDGVTATTSFAPATAGLADSERVLKLADVVLVNSAAEFAVVDALRPRRPTFVVAPLPVSTGGARPVGALVGSEPFVLVHAPIGPEGNQLMLARVAAEAGTPIVFAGPVADPSYADRLREFAPSRGMLLEEPSPEITASLYRTAAVIADAAWVARGHGRLLTAAAFGAAVVCSQTRWLDLPEGDGWTVDPADKSSIARGLGEAWEASVRGDARINRAAVFARGRLAAAAAAILACYAKIAQAI